MFIALAAATANQLDEINMFAQRYPADFVAAAAAELATRSRGQRYNALVEKYRALGHDYGTAADIATRQLG